MSAKKTLVQASIIFRVLSKDTGMRLTIIKHVDGRLAHSLIHSERRAGRELRACDAGHSCISSGT